MVNTIRQLQDLKEWAQDSTRYERRLNFRLAQKPYNWEEGDWWDADDESVGNTKILEDFEITDEMRRRPNAEGGVQQLVQPGPGRQGYQGDERKGVQVTYAGQKTKRYLPLKEAVSSERYEQIEFANPEMSEAKLEREYKKLTQNPEQYHAAEL